MEVCFIQQLVPWCIFSFLTLISFSLSFDGYNWRNKQFEGRYTRDIHDYEVVVPRRVDHKGSFVSYTLPNFFPRNTKRRKRNARLDSERLHYGVTFNGKDHVIEMWPNHGFLSPGLVLETRGPGAAEDLNKVKIRLVKDTQCHYTGWIKEEPGSRVALSLCDGVAGHIRTTRDHYYIEPVRDHEPEEDGQHLHLVYQRSAVSKKYKRSCGTNDDWEAAWSDRLESEYRHRRDSEKDLKADAAKRRKEIEAKAPAVFSDDKRVHTSSRVNYIETLLIADKKFLQARNSTDFEQYLFTIMNMVSDLYHDSSVGNQIDISLVRVIYLEKEEEEIDLMINTNADSTLESFCKWSKRINLEKTHPNHHDIAILVTKYDICKGSNCDTAGLAYVAGACSPNLTCGICEDIGLDLGTVMTHEIGHLLGSSHDSDAKKPGPGECPAMADDYRIHVMSPWSQYSTANWSSCSKRFITEFFDNDLGSCFLDEPQEHNFKIPQMPPGVVYDREWQCKEKFGLTEPCDLGPDVNCQALYCKNGRHCSSYGDPPVDGTSCGANKWCYERKCVDIGGRPEAINGQWSEWSSWSGCSRSCGGGASFMDRRCDNPEPANHGRYCVGKRRQYKLCNTEPCGEQTITFREEQCQEFNTDDVKWIPYFNNQPEYICKLLCLNNKRVAKSLAHRVKDGTPCKRGTRNRCIAGQCRKVGCDWILESDAVEDICGICNGDGSKCDVIDSVFNQTGYDYQKIVTIPAGSRHIKVEEMKPSGNAIGLSSADGKTFYLNGNHTLERTGEKKISGSIGLYTVIKPHQESLVLSGPIKEDIILYVLHNDNKNPDFHYKYSYPSNSSNYKPKFSWEFVEWGSCSVFCGGGTQMSESTCIEERGGRVSKMHCESIQKPEVNTRVCNSHPCAIRWRTGKWSDCDGCIDKPGSKYRIVDCVRQSPFEDSEVIIEESECKNPKPNDTEPCTSKEPCTGKESKKRGAKFGENSDSNLMPVSWHIVIPDDIDIHYHPSSDDNERNLYEGTITAGGRDMKAVEGIDVDKDQTKMSNELTVNDNEKIRLSEQEIRNGNTGEIKRVSENVGNIIRRDRLRSGDFKQRQKKNNMGHISRSEAGKGIEEEEGVVKEVRKRKEETRNNDESNRLWNIGTGQEPLREERKPDRGEIEKRNGGIYNKNGDFKGRIGVIGLKNQEKLTANGKTWSDGREMGMKIEDGRHYNVRELGRRSESRENDDKEGVKMKNVEAERYDRGMKLRNEKTSVDRKIGLQADVGNHDNYILRRWNEEAVRSDKRDVKGRSTKRGYDSIQMEMGEKESDNSGDSRRQVGRTSNDREGRIITGIGNLNEGVAGSWSGKTKYDTDLKLKTEKKESDNSKKFERTIGERRSNHVGKLETVNAEKFIGSTGDSSRNWNIKRINSNIGGSGRINRVAKGKKEFSGSNKIGKFYRGEEKHFDSGELETKIGGEESVHRIVDEMYDGDKENIERGEYRINTGRARNSNRKQIEKNERIRKDEGNIGENNKEGPEINYKQNKRKVIRARTGKRPIKYEGDVVYDVEEIQGENIGSNRGDDSGKYEEEHFSKGKYAEWSGEEDNNKGEGSNEEKPNGAEGDYRREVEIGSKERGIVNGKELRNSENVKLDSQNTGKWNGKMEADNEEEFRKRSESKNDVSEGTGKKGEEKEGVNGGEFDGNEKLESNYMEDAKLWGGEAGVDGNEEFESNYDVESNEAKEGGIWSGETETDSKEEFERNSDSESNEQNGEGIWSGKAGRDTGEETSRKEGTGYDEDGEKIMTNEEIECDGNKIFKKSKETENNKGQLEIVNEEVGTDHRKVVVERNERKETAKHEDVDQTIPPNEIIEETSCPPDNEEDTYTVIPMKQCTCPPSDEENEEESTEDEEGQEEEEDTDQPEQMFEESTTCAPDDNLELSEGTEGSNESVQEENGTEDNSEDTTNSESNNENELEETEEPVGENNEENYESTTCLPDTTEGNRETDVRNKGKCDTNMNTEECLNENKVKGKLIIDHVPPKNFKVIEVPISDSGNNYNISDEAFEVIGDSISNQIDASKAKEIKGKEIQKELKENVKLEQEKEQKTAEEEHESCHKSANKTY